MRDIACRLEPLARSERAMEQEKWFFCQLCHVERAPASEPMLARQHCQIEDWEEEPISESIVGHDQRQMNLALFKPVWQPQAAIFHEMHLNTGMARLILLQKSGECVLDHHRGRPHAQDSGLAPLQRTRSGAEQIGLHEEPSALPKQIFSL